VRQCSCGELLEDHVRFHWTGEGVGHYVDPEGEERTAAEAELDIAADPSWTINLRRTIPFWGAAPHRAPPPGPRPPKPWGKEEDLRRGAIKYLKEVGFAVYDLEQGYREDGSSRVGEGIGDAYIQIPGLSAWVEFKRWDNELSAKQRTFGTDELEAGGCYLVIYELGQLVEWNSNRRKS